MIGEYECEPVKGLPERLPTGEALLWQGAPRWQTLAVRVFHVRKVAIYFGLLAAWRVAEGYAGGDAPAGVALSVGLLALVAAAAGALLSLLAWLNARATVYTITDRRVVLRIGVALPMMVNLPLRLVESAAWRGHANGVGDVSLALPRGERVAYLHLWPHARPWRMARPEPTLRAVPALAAKVLGAALAASAGGSALPLDAAERASDAGARSGDLVSGGPSPAAA